MRSDWLRILESDLDATVSGYENEKLSMRAYWGLFLIISMPIYVCKSDAGSNDVLLMLGLNTLIGGLIAALILIKPTVAFYETVTYVARLATFFEANSDYLMCLDPESRFDPQIMQDRATEAVADKR